MAGDGGAAGGVGGEAAMRMARKGATKRLGSDRQYSYPDSARIVRPPLNRSRKLV